MSSIAFGLAVSTSPPRIMPADTLEHPSLLALLGYWEQLRGTSIFPARAEPRKEIRSLLKYVHVCEVVDQGRDFRFHLIGDAVFQGLNENQTGRLVSEHPDMGFRLRAPILMGEAVRTKKPVRGVAIRETEKDRFHAESIWLPFGDGGVTQVMGMTVMSVIDSKTH